MEQNERKISDWNLFELVLKQIVGSTPGALGESYSVSNQATRPPRDAVKNRAAEHR